MLPESGGRKLVVLEDGVVVGHSDDCGDLTLVGVDNILQLLDVIPLNVDVVFDVARCNTRVAFVLVPHVGAVVATLEHDDLVAAGGGAGGHHGQVGDVSTVLGEQ